MERGKGLGEKRKGKKGREGDVKGVKHVQCQLYSDTIFVSFYKKLQFITFSVQKNTNG